MPFPFFFLLFLLLAGAVGVSGSEAAAAEVAAPVTVAVVVVVVVVVVAAATVSALFFEGEAGAADAPVAGAATGEDAGLPLLETALPFVFAAGDEAAVTVTATASPSLRVLA